MYEKTTANEISRLMWAELLADMNMTEEEWYARQEKWRIKMGYPGY
jgi:hypothetical protein